MSILSILSMYSLEKNNIYIYLIYLIISRSSHRTSFMNQSSSFSSDWILASRRVFVSSSSASNRKQDDQMYYTTYINMYIEYNLVYIHLFVYSTA